MIGEMETDSVYGACSALTICIISKVPPRGLTKGWFPPCHHH